MKILIAPDSYKECLPAARVAGILSDELRRLRPDWQVVTCPLSDGGEGFGEILTAALGGERIPVSVTGPLGEPVQAFFGKAGETAVVETAAACGLSLVPPERRNPLKTTTRGVGELLLAAAQAGCREILVGVAGAEGQRPDPGILRCGQSFRGTGRRGPRLRAPEGGRPR